MRIGALLGAIAMSLGLMAVPAQASVEPTAPTATQDLHTLADGTKTLVTPTRVDVIGVRSDGKLKVQNLETGETMTIAGSGDCFYNTICFWIDKNYSGALYMYPSYNDGRKITFSTSLNNRTSSWYNRLLSPADTVGAFNAGDCSGQTYYMKPGNSNPDLSRTLNQNDAWSCINYATT